MPENDESLKSGGAEKMKEAYLEALLKENEARASVYPTKQLKTIYLGGGTPFQLGKERLFRLIDTLLETWDCEYLEELSIELNPDPFDEVTQFIVEAQKRYKNIFRLRFSFGIQTFDDTILDASKRNYIFNNLIHRLREVVEIKASTTCYNLDFIAFGDEKSKKKMEGDEWLPWDKIRREFFQKLIKSQSFDGVSVYTLELFPGAERYYEAKKSLQASGKEQPLEGAVLSDDASIWKEFQRLKKTVMDAGYHRYEISNFALRGKRSLHNMVYWNMEDYLGLGINASSCMGSTRFKNTTQWKQYLSGEWQDRESEIHLSDQETLSEEVMLLLRTDVGIQLEKYREVLVRNIDEVVQDLERSGNVVVSDEGVLKLTSKGMDVYNSVLLEVLEDF